MVTLIFYNFGAYKLAEGISGALTFKDGIDGAFKLAEGISGALTSIDGIVGVFKLIPFNFGYYNFGRSGAVIFVSKDGKLAFGMFIFGTETYGISGAFMPKEGTYGVFKSIPFIYVNDQKG